MININSPHPSSSEESLKEIPYQPHQPEIRIISPSESSVSKTGDHKYRDATPTESKTSHCETPSSARKNKPLQVAIDFAGDESEKVSENSGPISAQEVKKKKKKKKRTVDVEGEQSNGTEISTPRKKKKRKPKNSEKERELPPLVLMGRALPTLPSTHVQHEANPL